MSIKRKFTLTLLSTMALGFLVSAMVLFCGWGNSRNIVRADDPVSYDITYYLYGGTNGDNPSSYTVEDDIALNAPFKSGYHFAGWFTDNAFENEVTGIALGTMGEKVFYAKWETPYNTVSLTIGGDIKTNFYLDLEAYTQETRAYITFTYNHNKMGYDPNVETDTYYLEDIGELRQSDGTYKFSIGFAAGQMNEGITVNLYDYDDTLLWSKTDYSIRDYCLAAIKSNSDSYLVDLCKKMIFYGGYAQQLFDYDTENLVSDGLDKVDGIDDFTDEMEDAIAGVKYTDITSHKAIVNGLSELVIGNKAAFIALDTSSMYFYYTLDGLYDIEDYTITVSGGMSYRLGHDSGGDYIEVYGIQAVDLDTVFTITITKGVSTSSVTYSALDFARRRIETESASSVRSKFYRALYLYNLAADSYATHVYSLDTQRITIEYVYEDGTQAASPTILVLGNGEEYGQLDTASPTISGYAPNRYWFIGEATKSKKLVVTYSRISVWDGTIPTLDGGATAATLFSGSGTQESPYLIQSASDLAKLSALTAGIDYGSSSEYFKLTTSIDLSIGGWLPICHRGSFTDTSWKYFSSNFDGGGHTIIFNETISGGRGFGLFTGLNGTVTDLVFKGSVTANNRVGMVAYYGGTSTGTVKRVYNYSSITTTTSSADVYVGSIFGTYGSLIENCVNYGEIDCKGSLVGGIVGKGAGTISNCTNYGSVTGESQYVGGITGGGAGIPYYCVNYGDVTGGDAAIGGIIGSCTDSSVLYCQNYGTVLSTKHFGGIVGNTNNAIVTGCQNHGNIGDSVTNSESIGIAGIVGWCTNATVVTSCQNDGEIKGYSNVGGLVGYIGAAASVISGSNSGNIYGNNRIGQIAGYHNTPYSGAILQSNTTSGSTDRGESSSFDVWDGESVADGYESGSGTKGDPYIIASAEQFKFFADTINADTNGKAKDYKSQTGVYYKLACNVDMTAADWTPIAFQGAWDYKWTYFDGTFDGDNYTVKFKHNNTSNFGVGLFACVSGTVKNLTIKGDLNISHRGGSVAYIMNGTVTNIYSFVNITCNHSGTDAYTGGIAGSAVPSGTFTNCYYFGNISAGNNNTIGGICGYTQGGAFTNCENHGTIVGKNFVGGIIGYASNHSEEDESLDYAVTLSQTYNYGTVTGNNSVGGIIGYVKYTTITVNQAYNCRTITGSNYVGGFIGYARLSVTVTNSTFDGSVSGTTNYGNFIGYSKNESTTTDCSDRTT